MVYLHEAFCNRVTLSSDIINLSHKILDCLLLSYYYYYRNPVKVNYFGKKTKNK